MSRAPRVARRGRSRGSSAAREAIAATSLTTGSLEAASQRATEAALASTTSLLEVERALRAQPRRKRRTLTLADVARSSDVRSTADTATDRIATREHGAFDFVLPARPIAMELVGGRGHYERVIAAVTAAHTSVWIATANVKELMVEDGRARPGRRRSLKRTSYVSILALLDELAARGVELRLLHAELPSGPFREELAQHPRLVAGGLALRRCPRVHLKAVIVDGELLYLGSANWTGAGLGAKGSGRRNFELGFVTDDAPLLDQIQALYDRIWRGAECEGCKLRDECPGPLAEWPARHTDHAADIDSAASTPRKRLPVRGQIRRRARPRLI